MRFANYHTHTKRCGHAEGEDREYVEAAIAAGFRVLGFADHCPWVFPDKDYVSFMRMSLSEVEGYFHSLESLKKEYEKDIKIYIGFESEYCPTLMEEQEKLLRGYPLDYMILGQHFLGLEYDKVYSGRKTTDEEMLKRYVDTIIEGISTGKYLYVAHPDLINFGGEEEIYRKHMRRLCEAFKAADMPVEINMLGLMEERRYPSQRFLELAKETGNKAIIGVDAHEPGMLLKRNLFRRGEELCKEFGMALVDGDLLQMRQLTQYSDN